MNYILHITYFYTSPTYNHTFQTPGTERDLEKEGVGKEICKEEQQGWLQEGEGNQPLKQTTKLEV